MDIIQDVLIYQTQMMRNSSLGPYVPAEFSPPDHIVVVNALFYASLGVMILAAFIAMLIKSWVHEFDRGLRALSIPEQRAKTREFRYLGMERWKLPEMVAILPSLIQISLLLFAIGLVLFLFHISKPSFGVATAIFGIGVLYYAITTSISVFVASSPFHSPLSRTLGKVYRHVHAYFCPSIDHLLSLAMDMAPSTTLGRVRRNIQVILLKSRPYLEKDFEEPITAITVDEVQLFTSASALKRIHDSAPNSQHSLALQSSVWQVAGGTSHPFPPLFSLPSWILDEKNSEEHFPHLPPAILVAMVTISLRVRRVENVLEIDSGAVRWRMTDSEDPWTHVIMKVSDQFLGYAWWMIETVPDDLANMIRRKELHKDECLRLLRTLSELCSQERQSQSKPIFIGVCLLILMGHASKWDHESPPDIVLLEAVVTLAAISCTEERANRLDILSSSRDHPWLLLNIRNTSLISTLYERTPPDDHKQLASLLFLVVCALMYRESYALAVQYFTIITSKGGLHLYASALTAIAPSMTELGILVIGKAVVELRAEAITSKNYRDNTNRESYLLEGLFNSYDERLGATENPDPNIFAILLMLSKQHSSYMRERIQDGYIELENTWLSLAARVAAQLDVPDGPALPIGLFYDHRVRNMIAALSLLRYVRGNVTNTTESLLLASFLQSPELSISSVALEYYMKTTISYSDPPAPSRYLSAAVSSAFNVMLPEEQLCRIWAILDIYMDGFETLSFEWRRTFADGFFTLSRRPLLRPLGDMESSTPESELEAILTWEYLNEEEQEPELLEFSDEEEQKPELTDSPFSGLDWMAMAWSLHLSQQPWSNTAGSRQGKAQLQNLIGLEVNEEFVFRALSKLLDAAPYYRIIHILPKLREFIQWFDGNELPEYHSTVSTWVNETIRRHEEFQIHHRFRKFHCTWDT